MPNGNPNTNPNPMSLNIPNGVPISMHQHQANAPHPPHMIDRNLGGMHPQFKNSAGPMKNSKEYSYRY